MSTNNHPVRRAQVPRRVVLEEWDFLHTMGELSDRDPLWHRVVAAAPRIGMTAEALERALNRAGIRNPVAPDRTSHVRRSGRFGDCLECRKIATNTTEGHDDVRRLARRAARYPDRATYRAQLDQARDDLAATEAWAELHLELDHPGGAAA